MSGLVEWLLESSQDLRHQAHLALREPDAFALILDAEMAEEAAARITALEAENERLREALAFYADIASYCKLYIPGIPESDPRTFAPVLQDDGKQARQALGGPHDAD